MSVVLVNGSCITTRTNNMSCQCHALLVVNSIKLTLYFFFLIPYYSQPKKAVNSIPYSLSFIRLFARNLLIASKQIASLLVRLCIIILFTSA